MDIITLESHLFQNRSMDHPLKVMELKFLDDVMEIAICPGTEKEETCRSQLWSHTVYELEHLSEGLKLIANKRLRKYIEVPSMECLIGPKVNLRPGIFFQLGHPGINKDGRGAYVYCSGLWIRRDNRYLVDVEVTLQGRSAFGTFEPEQILEFSLQVYDQARRLEPKYVGVDDE
jgi:hypothetical protein